ncbi:P17/29C-like protein DDB_G0287399 [Tetranychus urticae]|uniref:TIL domain-containing protein n=1 Tax=Tetranychus urticae TaxID=32264 RepID=T1L6M4_TETUR|nr:P17/29C-like protein DDB_G0287399 [Tetranychus urticae]
MKSMIIILAMLFSFAACTLPDLSASIIIGTTGASKFTGCVHDASGKCVEQCEKPKVFLECGSLCPPTCAKPKPEACAAVCVKGCFCPKGTFLTDSGKCVEKCSSDGNPWCPNSKVYTDCGSACPPTCANPNPGPCAAVCVKGCFCPKGTLENASGECVKQCSSNGSNSSGSGSSASSGSSSGGSAASSSGSSAASGRYSDSSSVAGATSGGSAASSGGSSDSSAVASATSGGSSDSSGESAFNGDSI